MKPMSFFIFLLISRCASGDIENYEALKKDEITFADKRIEAMNEYKSCLQKTNNFKDMNVCIDKEKKIMDLIEKEQKKKHKEE
jgi:hypothetical protein